MKMHTVKCETEWLDAVIAGDKTFELRYDDRGYEVGDYLALEEWDPQTQEYKGQIVIVKVIYAFKDERWLQPNTIAMSIETLVSLNKNGIYLFD